MSSLLQMFFDDSSSDDDDDFFDMAAILLTGIAMIEQSKHGGSVPRREVVRRKLFDDYYSTEDESTAMSCANSGTIASSAARKKPPPLSRDGSSGSRLARRPKTHGGLVTRSGGEDGTPAMDLSGGEAPMTRRQKRKAWVQGKRKGKEVQAGGSSAEEEAGTEDGLDPAALAARREAKPSPKYLGRDKGIEARRQDSSGL